MTDQKWSDYVSFMFSRTNFFFYQNTSSIDIKVIDCYCYHKDNKATVYSWLNNNLYLPYYHKNNYVTVHNQD